MIKAQTQVSNTQKQNTRTLMLSQQKENLKNQKSKLKKVHLDQGKAKEALQDQKNLRALPMNLKINTKRTWKSTAVDTNHPKL